jgi:hypothetical protein
VYSSASLGNKNMKLRSSGGSGFARKEGGKQTRFSCDSLILYGGVEYLLKFDVRIISCLGSLMRAPKILLLLDTNWSRSFQSDVILVRQIRVDIP